MDELLKHLREVRDAVQNRDWDTLRHEIADGLRVVADVIDTQKGQPVPSDGLTAAAKPEEATPPGGKAGASRADPVRKAPPEDQGKVDIRDCCDEIVAEFQTAGYATAATPPGTDVGKMRELCEGLVSCVRGCCLTA